VRFPRCRAWIGIFSVVLLVSGCAAPASKAPVSRPVCSPAAANDALVGNWLSVHKQAGVAGELHTLFTLKPDGTMAYAERLKRGRNPSQGLSETGCWEHTGKGLRLRTLTSNGVPVDLDDPIYINDYSIVSLSGASLQLVYQGATLRARKMPADYQLPW
jgi:hypothetical protein